MSMYLSWSSEATGISMDVVVVSITYKQIAARVVRINTRSSRTEVFAVVLLMVSFIVVIYVHHSLNRTCCMCAGCD